jgi:hypothetical protein
MAQNDEAPPPGSQNHEAEVFLSVRLLCLLSLIDYLFKGLQT